MSMRTPNGSEALLCGLLVLLCRAPVLGWTQGNDQEPNSGPTTALASIHFGSSQLPHKGQGAVRLATYNVLNLFDHRDDPALAGDFEDLDLAMSESRCRALAEVIRDIDADIIALQEVESIEALTWFRDTYLPDAGYEHIASHDVGEIRGIECSVLSRHPIIETKVWTDERLDVRPRIGEGFTPNPGVASLRFARSPLMTVIRIGDAYELTVISLHHKAGRGDENAYRREAEALRLIDLVQSWIERNPGRNIALMGDFNAAPWSKSVRLYRQAGFIDTLSHRSTSRGSVEARLFKTHESGRILDYILLNSAAHRELVIDSPRVRGTRYEENYDWKTDPYPEGYASDHYPVIMDLIPRDRR